MTLSGSRPLANTRLEGFEEKMATIGRRLVIVGFEPLNQSSHWFNELMSFQTEASGLGLAVRILLPRSADASLAAALSADTCLTALPAMSEINADNFAAEAINYADTADILVPLWGAIQDLGAADLVYFPRGHPIMIRAVGAWLAVRSPELRPSIFFRIIGDELTDLETGRFRKRGAFYRLACADLSTRAGQDRVFFLVNSAAKARAVSRVCQRRSFMMQHHFGGIAGNVPTTVPTNPVIYVHFNDRSGRLARNFGEIARRVVLARPDVRFLLHGPERLIEPIHSPESAIKPFMDVLSQGLGLAEYVAGLARSTLVFLAYEAQPYKSLTSGVFTEAASLGKPLVVPAETWMAQKITEGFGVGASFSDHTEESISTALLNALNNSDQLGASARAIVPRLRVETGCRRFIERMIELSQTSPDMKPCYELNNDVHFNDEFDSRSFMRDGWGDTEWWGAWTIAEQARLSLRLEAEQGQLLFLNVFARAYLGHGQKPLRVYVTCAGEQIAEWAFAAEEDRWLTAQLPVYYGQSSLRHVDLLFTIDAPSSPYDHGLSGDRRSLGFGVSKLSLTTRAIDVRGETRDEDAVPAKQNVFARAVRRLMPS